MTEFMEEFMREMAAAFPKLLVQFEDFATDKAFGYLARFRDRYALFNDDIQGTGAVVLAGFLNAARLASAARLSRNCPRVRWFGRDAACQLDARTTGRPSLNA